MSGQRNEAPSLKTEDSDGDEDVDNDDNSNILSNLQMQIMKLHHPKLYLIL
jgi:hypothetical protein